jgi:outer membrane protein OmpA-like peptidoglycan-associated protein
MDAPPPAPTRSVTPAPPPQAAAPPPSPPVPTQPQVAAAPPVAIAAGAALARIDFASGGTDLNDNGKRSLDRAVAELQRDQNARLQLVAYATGGSGDDGGSVARRVSLSRALAVRSYLIEQGIRATRMDVRALGSRSADGSAASDRVDVLLVRR